ncbi:MAG: HEPN domain-containing protein [SAR324 cluster bacterium]|nr:HEPN domain-containing protein [SAR324 cluster bacterium]
MTESIKDLVNYRLTRSEETLEEARILANVGHWNACVNRLYYACFYAVSALLILDNLSCCGLITLEYAYSRSSAKVKKKEVDFLDSRVFARNDTVE